MHADPKLRKHFRGPLLRKVQDGRVRLFATTGDAVGIVDDGAVGITLEGSGAQCISADPHDANRVYVGTFDRGVYRSLDGGESWDQVGNGIPHKRVLSIAIGPHTDNGRSIVYAGTEPSSVFRSTDDGSTWEDLSALRDVPSYDTWFFPPRPETHHVRWIAPHERDRDTIVVGIELGGVLRTRDGGATWQDRHPDAVIDPHVVHSHPSATDRIYAIGGDGVSFSTDGGESWTRDVDGMDRQYTWALAVDPEDPDLWYVSAAPDPFHAHGKGDAQARLFRKRGTSPWEPIEVHGFGGVTTTIERMPYALVVPRTAPGTLFCGLRDGTILSSEDAGDSWRTTAKVPRTLALAVTGRRRGRDRRRLHRPRQRTGTM
jgi:photosystem II stability/assembly factor-like uncharacterized protein